MKNGHDYLVEKGKVVLLDETDGRLKNGVKVNTGLHQAVEQKEHVKVTDNQKPLLQSRSQVYSGCLIRSPE